MRHAYLKAAILSALVWGGCTEEIVLVDPEVTFDRVRQGQVTGPLALTLGMYSEQFFDPLQPGDDLPIIFGLQGGTWVMPAIRATGLLPVVTVDATIMTESGDVVGALRGDRKRMAPQPNGALDIEAIPIPIVPPRGTEMDALYGQAATITLSIEDEEGRKVETSVEVVLVDG